MQKNRFEIHLINNLGAQATGITNLTAPNGMHSFYQNGILNIQLFDQNINSAQVSLVDLSGQTLYNSETSFAQGKAQIAISTLASGIYLVTAKTSNGVYTEKTNIIR